MNTTATTFRAVSRIYPAATTVEIAEAFIGGEWKQIEQPLTPQAILRIAARGATMIALRVDGVIADFPVAELAVTARDHAEELSQLSGSELIKLHQLTASSAVWKAALIAVAREEAADPEGSKYWIADEWNTPNGGTSIMRLSGRTITRGKAKGKQYCQRYVISRREWTRRS